MSEVKRPKVMKFHGKARKYKTYIVYAAMGIGGALTGIMLIPIGILAVMIYTIWAIINHIVRWCDKGNIL